MEITNQYTEFYLGEFLFNVKEKIDVTNFIIQSFPSVFIVKIKTENDVIYFDLEGNSYDTEVKGLTWRYFSNTCLLQIKEFLNVEIREIVNSDNKDNLIVCYRGKTLNVASKVFANKKIIFFYNLDLPDLYRGAGTFDGCLYVHSIVEVIGSELE